MKDNEIDTTNDSLVCVRGSGQIALLRPRAEYTKDQALRMAAWIVALADDEGEFDSLLEAVRNT
jgi:hypothetical protein